MRNMYRLIGGAIALSAPAAAELPTPPENAAAREAPAYLFHSGAGDVFEITSSMLALKSSQNSAVRAYAAMLIGDHTNLTNTALATSKSAGVMPPPPILSSAQRAMITQLIIAGPRFDRMYMQHQVAAHQMALRINQAYAASGDTPALRQAAATAVPLIQRHLAEAQQLLSATR